MKVMEMVWVFIVGGGICVIGQILLDTTKLTAPRILVIFVVSGAILGGLGVYEPFVEFAKSGATVPLPGFGYSLAKGAIEGVQKEGLLGAITGGITQTAAGIAMALVFGYFVAVIFSPKSRR